MSDKITYSILITPINAKDASYTIEITTDDIENSMDQYGRNRDAFSWQINK